MSTRVLLLIGTKKGAFVAESDASRREWRLSSPLISGTWAVYHLCYDRSRGAIYAGAASNWYGAAVWKSTDLGATWTHSSDGLSYGDDGPDVEQVWCVAAAGGAVYAGVEPAGLFRSDDGGRTWLHLPALRGRAAGDAWRPSGGGLCLHAVRPGPDDSRPLWVAVGAGGVYRAADGGESWTRCSGAAVGAAVGAGAATEAQPSACVHALAVAPDGSRLYQQSHNGVFRSDDGGGTWHDVTPGLPSPFGFPLAVHPRDGGTAYVVPLEGQDAGRRHVPSGEAAVWRTRDAGATWQQLRRGLPAGRTYLSVLRAGLATDDLDPAGVYFGTPTGQLYGSADEGDSWFTVATGLPPIYAVTAVMVER